MKDPHDSPIQGGTRWRRFIALLAPAVAVTVALVFGMAHGAIAASFTVSGQTFKVSASRLEGDGFVQYSGVVVEKDGTVHPVAVAGVKNAKLFNLCQSVKVPNMPVVLVIRAGGNGTPVSASNLLIDADMLEGDAVFTTVEIGRDAATLDAGPDGAVGSPGLFGQQVQKVVIKDLKVVARRTSVGTFTLEGLTLKVATGADAKGCF